MRDSEITEEGGRRRSERKRKQQCRPPTQTPLLASEPVTLPPLKQPRKTASQLGKEYRERLKRDPVKYHQHLEENKKRCKLYRDNADKESKKRMGQQATIRSAKKRKRDKEELEALPLKRTTCKEDGSKRAIWVGQKRKQRAAMNGQQVRRNNEKRRDKRASDRLAKQRQAHAMLQATVMIRTASSTRTPEAMRQSLCRARKRMPKHADSYADASVDLITNEVTTRKKTALEEHGVLPSAEQEEHVGECVQTDCHVRDLSNKPLMAMLFYSY